MERKFSNSALVRRLCLAPGIGKLAAKLSHNTRVTAECPSHGILTLLSSDFLLIRNLGVAGDNSYTFPCPRSIDGEGMPEEHQVTYKTSRKIANLLMDVGVRVQWVEAGLTDDHPLISASHDHLGALTPDEEMAFGAIDLDTFNQTVQAELSE